MQVVGCLSGHITSAVTDSETYLRSLLPFQSTTSKLPLLLGVVTISGAYAARATWCLIHDVIRTFSNDKKRKRKQDACQASIKALEEHLAKHPVKKEEVARIISMTLQQLTGHLKARTLRPIDVLRAYQTKALEAHKKTNCLVEVITEAEEWARALEKGPTDGVLYGVPVSVKDDVGIKGYDCTLGCTELAEKPMLDDACILKVLRGRHGAIPFVKTNVPQTEAAFEPGNPINGPVYNPHNLAHGPGGSSSGEGALIASGGSILGIGSDVGGSIRVPSHLCGICGFKPTNERISRLGSFSTPVFNSPIYPSHGPLARDVDSLAFTMKALWDGSLNDLDPAATPMPFNSLVYEDKTKLRIGYYFHDGMFPLFPGCERAVQMAKKVLEQRGHELVAWTPPDIDQGLELYFRIIQSDSNTAVVETLKCDEVSSNVKLQVSFLMVPRILRWLFVQTMWPFMPKLATLVDCTLGQPDVLSYWKSCQSLRDYCQMVDDRWRDKKLDAVICPPFAFASLPLGNSLLNNQGATYGMIYNALNFPAGVVRMTKVKAEDLDAMQDFPTENQFYQAAKEGMLKAEGLPMGVMVASRRYHDEVCLRVMREVETRAEFKVIPN